MNPLLDRLLSGGQLRLHRRRKKKQGQKKIKPNPFSNDHGAPLHKMFWSF